MKVYIAGPFFNPFQVAVIESIENLLADSSDIEFYSPRTDGVVMNMTVEERKQNSKRLFDLNKSNILDADLVVAVIDDKDTGTIWEMGFAHAKGIDIVSFTNQNYGVNLMLSESVVAHCRGIGELEDVIVACLSDDRLALVNYRKFAET
jgi:nucleoside 2-deoxyribosyltransferase